MISYVDSTNLLEILGEFAKLKTDATANPEAIAPAEILS